MALKIRLRQQGRRHHLVYRLIVTDARVPRDGKYLEMLGWYDPHRQEQPVHLHSDRIAHWLANGAELTEKAEKLVKGAAPEVFNNWKQKQIARKAKLCAKRKKTRNKPEVAVV